jgi:hypothetical protein
MKYLLIALLALGGCGKKEVQIVGPKGEIGAIGQRGPKGNDGDKGDKGDTGETGATGPQGPVGPMGPQGQPGTPGLSCSVSPLVNGAALVCQDGSYAEVFNGTNGANGNDGADGQDGEDGQDGTNGTVVTPIELCPSLSGGLFKEHLIRIGNDLFGVYASGQSIGYAKLWPGSWITTDGRSCHFTIHSDLSVTF